MDSLKPAVMRLKCAKCGHTARYDVGKVILDPFAEDDPDYKEDPVAFTGYFRCKKCNSAGPWLPTADAYKAIESYIVALNKGIEEERVTVGRAYLFDGTLFRSAAQAEEYLKGILEREPDNAFIWNRLGNIYVQANLYRKAVDAFRKALEISPNHLESHFSLGWILHEAGEYPEAAKHFNSVITLAPMERGVPEEKLRWFVEESLEMLVDIAEYTGSEIPVLIPLSVPDPRASAKTDRAMVVRMTDTNTIRKSDISEVAESIVGVKGGAAFQQSPMRSRKIGRNEPCPCGSGKKYKKCCGA